MIKLNFSQWVNPWKHTPLLSRTVCVWLFIELIGIFILPVCIPRTSYLSWYLGPQAIEATHKFLRGDASLVPDKNSGWRNKPNFAKGNWVIDASGGRSTLQKRLEPFKGTRVIMLGNSMVNGGMHVSNNETISAFLETKDIEVLNFGTMVYSLDQCLLSYRYSLYKYNANLVIVGLDLGSIEGLLNHYIPFRVRDEKNMPYLKPRFELINGSMQLISISPESQLANIPDSPELLEFLEKHDQFYYYFRGYCRMGLFPLTASIRAIYRKMASLYEYLVADKGKDNLLLAVMDDMVYAARTHDAQVVFIMMPHQDDFTKTSIHRFFPDTYARMFHLIESRGFSVVDIRRVFLMSNQSASQLFHEDGTHYTPLANHLIARVLKNRNLSSNLPLCTVSNK
jgi:hypothetical protein